MEIRAGLTYMKEMGMLSKIPSELATKVMMIHITSIDGKACIPFLFLPTISATYIRSHHYALN